MCRYYGGRRSWHTRWKAGSQSLGSRTDSRAADDEQSLPVHKVLITCVFLLYPAIPLVVF